MGLEAASVVRRSNVHHSAMSFPLKAQLQVSWGRRCCSTRSSQSLVHLRSTMTSSGPRQELKVLAIPKRQCCQHALSKTNLFVLVSTLLPKATQSSYSNDRRENRSSCINNAMHSKNLLVSVLDVRFRTYLRLPDVQPLLLAMSSICLMPRYYKSKSAVRKPYHRP